MADFKTSTHGSEEHGTKATAQLPGLDIEIVHRRSPAGDHEQIAITLQATPSFEAFGRYFDLANPLAFWAQAVRLAYLPWLEASRVVMLPWQPALPQSDPNDPSPGPSDRH